jgi:hypothetical protein
MPSLLTIKPPGFIKSYTYPFIIELANVVIGL